MHIFVTRKLPGDDFDRLLKFGGEVMVSKVDRVLTQEELLESIKGVDGILSLLTDQIDGEVMDAAGPTLRVIANYAVGFDNIDIEAATSRGIVVTNTPSEVVNESVAEHTWALILSLTRRIVESDESVRQGAYKGWEPNVFLGSVLKGKTMGIVGLGRIGKMVAKRAKGYEMNICYTKRTPEPEIEKELGITFRTLDELLVTSDIVTIHVPLLDETRGMFDESAFSKMKKGSYLINTARGPIVKEDDLVSALRSGHLAGAALDVFENEPNINPELISMGAVVLTPHIASATIEARDDMTRLAVDGLLKGLSGNLPVNIVNKEVWGKRRK